MISTSKRSTWTKSSRNTENGIIDQNKWRILNGGICTGSWTVSRTQAAKEQVSVPQALKKVLHHLAMPKHLTESQSISSTDIEHEDTIL